MRFTNVLFIQLATYNHIFLKYLPVRTDLRVIFLKFPQIGIRSSCLERGTVNTRANIFTPCLRQCNCRSADRPMGLVGLR